MERPEIGDYDRVIAHFKRELEFPTVEGDRRVAAEDMIQLLNLASHWIRVFNQDPIRKGNPFNLALLNWMGLNPSVRIPQVFAILGYAEHVRDA